MANYSALLFTGLVLSISVSGLLGCNSGGGTPPLILREGAYTFQAHDSDLLIALQIDGSGTSAPQNIRVYTCDGRPDTDVEWFKGVITGDSLTLRSLSQNATITLDFTTTTISGLLTESDGESTPYSAGVASPGDGIYTVTIAADGSYSGESLSGDLLTAMPSTIAVSGEPCDGKPILGTLTPPAQAAIDFNILNLCTCTEPELAEHDHPAVFADPDIIGSVPGTYVAVVHTSTTRGLHVLGRDINDPNLPFRTGTALNNPPPIIGLNIGRR